MALMHLYSEGKAQQTRGCCEELLIVETSFSVYGIDVTFLYAAVFVLLDKFNLESSVIKAWSLFGSVV